MPKTRRLIIYGACGCTISPVGNRLGTDIGGLEGEKVLAKSRKVPKTFKWDLLSSDSTVENSLRPLTSVMAAFKFKMMVSIFLVLTMENP